MPEQTETNMKSVEEETVVAEQDPATLEEAPEIPEIPEAQIGGVSIFHARRVLITQGTIAYGIMGILLDIPNFSNEGYVIINPVIVENPWTSSTSLEDKIEEALNSRKDKIDLSNIGAADLAFLIKEAIDFKRSTAMYHLPNFMLVPYNKVSFIYLVSSISEEVEEPNLDEETEDTNI